MPTKRERMRERTTHKQACQKIISLDFQRLANLPKVFKKVLKDLEIFFFGKFFKLQKF